MSVLRLLDAHTRSYAEVRPTCPGLLLVCAQVPGVTEAADLTGPRVLLLLLLADLLTARASSAETQAALGGPIDVHLASHGAPADDRLSGLVVPVGAARTHREAGTAAGLLAGDEPMAVRLALLSFPIISQPT